MRAMGELLKEGTLEKDRLTIRFIGKCRYAVGKSVMEMAAQYGLEGIVEIKDLLPRSEALREMLSAHVLLLLATRQVLQVPGKAYEYIAAGGRILAETEPKGATADLIHRLGVGAVVPPGDHESIKRVLKAWYADYIVRDMGGGCELPPRSAALKEYEWTQLGIQYARVLEECVEPVIKQIA